jgi:glycosyltransferase involved in cell wall biosynthesis
MIRLAHVITGLGTGGAETTLLRLLSHMNRERFDPCVYSLSVSSGPIESEIRTLGIPVRSFRMSATVPNPLPVLALSRSLHRQRADVVQTWMYHADLVGGVAARMASRETPVIWGIRNGNLNPRALKPRTMHFARACAWMSTRLPRVIVCCGYAARDMHSAIGYDRNRISVIPNGFDVHVFRPDPDARRGIREELGIPSTTMLVGCVGRFHPDKDPRNFVDAAAQLHAQRPDVHFLLCGRGLDDANRELAQWIDTGELRGVVHLLGERRDVPRVLAALDLATSPSRAEAFPNVVGEAMACGVPCVVTDVGDSALLVGATGRVVPPEAPAALAEMWLALLSEGSERLRALGRQARQRIEATFSIERMVRAYEAMYTAAAERRVA